MIIFFQVRLGVCDADVKTYMEEHVRECPNEDENERYASGKLCIIVTTNIDRDAINSEKLQKLLPDKAPFYSDSIDVPTNMKNPPPLKENAPLTETGQLQTKFIFKQNAPVMITSNSSQKKYKNNGIVNGARGYIDSIQPSKENPQVADVIWVRFNDDNTGQLLRQDNLVLLREHRPVDPLAVPIKKQRKSFKQKNVSWTREQFPLTLCYSITSHKV